MRAVEHQADGPGDGGPGRYSDRGWPLEEGQALAESGGGAGGPEDSDQGKGLDVRSAAGCVWEPGVDGELWRLAVEAQEE